MEAPQIKEECKSENSFQIQSDKNHSFNIIFTNLTTSIKITASFEDDILIKLYEKTLSLDELKKNKFFVIYDSIDEIYDELIYNLNKNQSKIIEETNLILLFIPVDNLKIKEITFELSEKIKSDKERIDELISVVSNLNEEIKELKSNNIKIEENIDEKINNLEKENSNLKQKINSLEIEVSEFKKENKKLIEKINKIEKELKQENSKSKDQNIIKENSQLENIKSKILKINPSYKTTLNNWINPKETIKFELLYRMSRDGIEFSKFHKLCDNKGPTITLIKLENENILGSYSPLAWDSKSSWKRDPNMFIFSLTNNTKSILNSNSNNGIYCYSECGPHNDVIRFRSDKKMKECYIYNQSKSYVDAYKIFPGDKNEGYYKCQEIEVFQIQF